MCSVVAPEMLASTGSIIYMVFGIVGITAVVIAANGVRSFCTKMFLTAIFYLNYL